MDNATFLVTAVVVERRGVREVAWTHGVSKTWLFELVGLGRRFKGTQVLLLTAGRDVRVLREDGQLIRAFTLDPTKDYQPVRA